jgi:hypothetical protein
LKIEPVNKSSAIYPHLLRFIEKHRLFFNSPAWTDNYHPENIIQCAILNNNNEIIGCFIYYRFNKFVFPFIITPPFSPNIDLFYLNPSESVVGVNSFNKEILAVVADYFDGLGVSYLNINLPDTTVDTQPFTWKGFTSKNRYSYLIDLALSKEELWDNLSTEKRKSLNKASKDELVVTETTDFQLVYSLIVRSLARNNKAKNLAVIKNILFSFATPANSYAFVASNKGVAVGATFCVVDKQKAIYLFGGFDSENKHHGAGVSCMWQSILKAKELNLKYFDFEGSMNRSIERYFREFGGKLTPYFCVEKIKTGLNLLMKLKGYNPA